MSQPELIRDTLCVSELLLDASSEQSVELDYVLPDYYPNIFKLLKTSVTPAVQSYKISGSQLIFDGSAEVRILYLPEDGGRICCVQQNIPFSKTVDLPCECSAPWVQILPRCYFANGRAVNPRRLDVRGGISCKVRVSDQKEIPAVTGGSGAGMQFRQQKQTLCGGRKSAVKTFSISEELTLPDTKPAFSSLLHWSAAAVPTETRLIANKAICKADFTIRLFYLPQAENEPPQSVEFTIPVSQIADLPGADEQDSCTVSFVPAGLTIEPRAGENGENRVLSCTCSLLFECCAVRNTEVILADDAYSTLYETTVSSAPAAAERLLETADLTATSRNTVETPAPVSAVCEVWASAGECSLRLEEGALLLSGNLELTACCIGADGAPFILDKTIPVEIRLLSDLEAEEISMLPRVEVLSCGFAILSENSLEIRTELRVSGLVCEKCRFPVIRDITVNEDAPRCRDPRCALRICYADAGENLWDIAKSCSTSMAAVLEENALESERLESRTMLLIPLIDG